MGPGLSHLTHTYTQEAHAYTQRPTRTHRRPHIYTGGHVYTQRPHIHIGGPCVHTEAHAYTQRAHIRTGGYTYTQEATRTHRGHTYTQEVTHTHGGFLRRGLRAWSCWGSFRVFCCELWDADHLRTEHCTNKQFSRGVHHLRKAGTVDRGTELICSGSSPVALRPRSLCPLHPGLLRSTPLC